jgi:hypothetical protein
VLSNLFLSANQAFVGIRKSGSGQLAAYGETDPPIPLVSDVILAMSFRGVIESANGAPSVIPAQAGIHEHLAGKVDTVGVHGSRRPPG